MEQDIRKLAVWIEKATRERIALERQILEWKNGVIHKSGKAKKVS